MKDKILKQIESEAFRRFPVELTRDKVDENSYRRKVFTENCEWYHNNIKESVDEKMIKNIEIVLPSATSACKYNVQVKSMVGEVLFEHTFYGDSIPILSASQNSKSNEGEKWVSVDDRLPKAYETIISYNIHTDEVSTDYIDDEKRWDVLNPTHWMPLPQPPKEK